MRHLRVTPKQRLRLAYAVWGWTPHESQRRFMESEAAEKIGACGRRWGKTECLAVDVATAAIVCPGLVQMIVSPTYDQSRLVFNRVENLLAANARSRRLMKCVRTPYPILTYQGGSIQGRTADEDGRNLRGHAADRVFVDEAAFVRDGVVDEVLRPMLADTDGQMTMMSTPFGRNHFYRAFLNESGFSMRCPTWDNPHISGEYVARQRDVLSERMYRVEYGGEFADSSQSVFPMDVVAAATRASGGEVVSGARVAGVDWARYSDYTSVAIGSAAGERFDLLEVARFRGVGWEEQVRRVLGLLRQWQVSAVLMDQTGVGDPVMEMAQREAWVEESMPVDIEGVVFTNQNKRMMMESLLLGMERGIVTLPDDPVLMRELEYYEFTETDAGNVRLGARAGEHDDTVCSLALAYELSRRWRWPSGAAGTIGEFPTHMAGGVGRLPSREEWLNR